MDDYEKIKHHSAELLKAVRNMTGGVMRLVVRDVSDRPMSAVFVMTEPSDGLTLVDKIVGEMQDQPDPPGTKGITKISESITTAGEHELVLEGDMPANEVREMLGMKDGRKPS